MPPTLRSGGYDGSAVPRIDRLVPPEIDLVFFLAQHALFVFDDDGGRFQLQKLGEPTQTIDLADAVAEGTFQRARPESAKAVGQAELHQLLIEGTAATCCGSREH